VAANDRYYDGVVFSHSPTPDLASKSEVYPFQQPVNTELLMSAALKRTVMNRAVPGWCMQGGNLRSRTWNFSTNRIAANSVSTPNSTTLFL